MAGASTTVSRAKPVEPAGNPIPSSHADAKESVETLLEVTRRIPQGRRGEVRYFFSGDSAIAALSNVERVISFDLDQLPVTKQIDTAKIPAVTALRFKRLASVLGTIECRSIGEYGPARKHGDQWKKVLIETQPWEDSR